MAFGLDLRVGSLISPLIGSLINLASPAATAAPAVPAGMRLIPAGEFRMGSTEDRAWAEERPAHRVRLSHAYLIDETEVTNAQFERFVRATGYKTLAERPVDLLALMAQLPPGTPPPAKAMLRPNFNSRFRTPWLHSCIKLLCAVPMLTCR